jgi:FkbM family methyltransferase
MNIRKSVLSAGRSLRDRFVYGPHEKLQQEWRKKKGDLTMRLDYDFLNENSVVFDLGGYEGQFASDIYAKYGCTVYVFEPVPQYADFIRKRFSQNPKIKVFTFGLGSKTEEMMIKVSEESSSLYLDGAGTSVRIEDLTAFVHKEGIKTIDLMKLNIEGGEYDVVPYLVATGYIKHVRAIQIQFHKFVKDAKARMDAIREDLKKTHVCDYCYEFTWEGWSRKAN